MILLLLLLACVEAPGTPDGPGTDPGPDLTPVWSGTQIGEEGDDCPIMTTEDNPDVQDLRAALSLSVQGTFISAWQGEAPLSLDVVPDGSGYTLTDCSDERFPAVQSQVTLQVGELLTVQRSARLSALPFGAQVAHGDLHGELSPGVLPDDAGELVLELLVGEYAGEARWILERPGGAEWALAGSWQTD